MRFALARRLTSEPYLAQISSHPRPCVQSSHQRRLSRPSHLFATQLLAADAEVNAEAFQPRTVRIERVQIEMDTGKTVHGAGPRFSASRVSLGRCARTLATPLRSDLNLPVLVVKCAFGPTWNSQLAEPGQLLVDYNRAGCALLEIVSSPDMRSGEEAAAYVRKVQRILRCVRAVGQPSHNTP